MKEIWKDIPDYEGLYQVSNMGRVKSLNYMGNKGREEILHQRINGDGYCDVRLSKNDHRKRKLVHRLVLKAFLYDSDMTVNHINEIRTDNRLENLEYMTSRDNVSYSQAIPIEITFLDGTKKKYKSANHASEEIKATANGIALIAKNISDGRTIFKINGIKSIEYCERGDIYAESRNQKCDNK